MTYNDNPNRVKLGTLTLSQPRTFTNRYETAAWYDKVEVQPGEYPVIAHLAWRGGQVSVQSIGVSLPGIVTEAFFPSLFAGVRINASNNDQSVGRPGTARVGGVYGYDVADALAKGRPIFGGVLTLDPGFVVRDGQIVRSQ